MDFSCWVGYHVKCSVQQDSALSLRSMKEANHYETEEIYIYGSGIQLPPSWHSPTAGSKPGWIQAQPPLETVTYSNH